MALPTVKHATKLRVESNKTSHIQLSPSVSLFRQGPGISAANSTGPELILLATWMDARDIHISKYIDRYQTLYPTAHILVTKSFFRYYFSPSSAQHELLPAVEVIRDVLGHSSSSSSNQGNRRPRMLIHIFSNGGSCMLYNLYDMYAKSKPTYRKSMAPEDKENFHHDNSDVLPPHVTIFDSVPGRWSYSGSTQGVLAGLPAGWVRRLAFPIVHLLGLWWIIKYMLLKIPEETHVWGLAHNDPSKAKEVCRSYVYSQADGLVYYLDVEEHADHAEANGFVVLRREKLCDSQHVSHARSYPDQYWAVVKDTWEAGQHDSSRG
ncbi:hypothetical protein N431DRAFT_448777 [Stipitochalara longipes BDJ]|nr:hypothetical protein N431DRAFT_448777 [Stipitochalara longipes BDJ]